MSRRAARFEICRGDDGWWARYRAANGRVVWVTETYERRRAAERAICLLGKAEWGRGHLVWLLLHDGRNGLFTEVREVDERRPPAKTRLRQVEVPV